MADMSILRYFLFVFTISLICLDVSGKNSNFAFEKDLGLLILWQNILTRKQI